ncbi:hypothetical protein IWX49DRAFT_341496 [Phyllosticta citricarpa]|uniref:GATA-type domain-containing protein n=1 Tax=Phyllosticta citricarpa TaxID=55181 RepID=A0ABR1MV07_9PEZI
MLQLSSDNGIHAPISFWCFIHSVNHCLEMRSMSEVDDDGLRKCVLCCNRLPLEHFWSGVCQRTTVKCQKCRERGRRNSQRWRSTKSETSVIDIEVLRKCRKCRKSLPVEHFWSKSWKRTTVTCQKCLGYYRKRRKFIESGTEGDTHSPDVKMDAIKSGSTALDSVGTRKCPNCSQPLPGSKFSGNLGTENVALCQYCQQVPNKEYEHIYQRTVALDSDNQEHDGQKMETHNPFCAGCPVCFGQFGQQQYAIDNQNPIPRSNTPTQNFVYRHPPAHFNRAPAQSSQVPTHRNEVLPRTNGLAPQFNGQPVFTNVLPGRSNVRPVMVARHYQLSNSNPPGFFSRHGQGYSAPMPGMPSMNPRTIPQYQMRNFSTVQAPHGFQQRVAQPPMTWASPAPNQSRPHMVDHGHYQNPNMVPGPFNDAQLQRVSAAHLQAVQPRFNSPPTTPALPARPPQITQQSGGHYQNLDKIQAPVNSDGFQRLSAAHQQIVQTHLDIRPISPALPARPPQFTQGTVGQYRDPNLTPGPVNSDEFQIISTARQQSVESGRNSPPTSPALSAGSPQITQRTDPPPEHRASTSVPSDDAPSARDNEPPAAQVTDFKVDLNFHLSFLPGKLVEELEEAWRRGDFETPDYVDVLPEDAALALLIGADICFETTEKQARICLACQYKYPVSWFEIEGSNNPSDVCCWCRRVYVSAEE